MYQRHQDTGVGFLTGIVTGAMFGAALGLLFARKPGVHLREDIRESAESLRDAIARRYREAAERAGIELENLHARAEEAASSIETTAREWAESAAQRVTQDPRRGSPRQERPDSDDRRY